MQKAELFIKPTWPLKCGIYFSSILITILGFIFLFLEDNIYLFDYTFLLVPIISVYLLKKNIKLIISYIIIDIHFIFWFLACFGVNQSCRFDFITPFFMMGYFLLLILKRKSNFYVIVDAAF